MEKFEEKYKKYQGEEKKVRDLYHKIALSAGLSDSALWTLYSLYNKKSISTQKSLAEELGLAKQTVNSAVNRLLKREYLELEQMNVGRNQKKISLTHKGLSLCEKVIGPLIEAQHRAFFRFSQDEQEMLLSLAIRHHQYLAEELKNLRKHFLEEERGRR